MEDASTLRWILIIAGVALLGGLLLFGNPNRKPRKRKPKKRAANRRKPLQTASERREPTLEGDSAGEGSAGSEPSRFDSDDFAAPPPEDFSADQGELPIGEEAEPAEAGSPAAEEPEPPPYDAPEKVVVLYLQARDNRKVVGTELMEVASKSGLEFGEMSFFHRRVDGHKQPLFSMANLENPGTFDRESWPTLETRGVTLFMGLPGPMGALYAWDAMVATSRRMGELLHLDVLDENRNHFTRQREGEIREELREFERQQQPEG
ncbi:MAG: cell division protein ZipA [Xanthomonadales bacterium]|jgi:cell division protein ZipA|nr:cell division protein ZipA [Xanthomonadales bacterium]